MFGFLAKLGLPLISGIASNAIRITVITAILGLGGFAWLTKHDSVIYRQAIDSCPKQNLYTGPTTVIQNAGNKMRCFPLAISKWGIGICHD